MADLLMIGLGVDTRQLRDGERALGRLQRAGNNTENALKRMAGALAGLFATSKIIEYADAYTSLQNKLKLVTNSTTELGYATEEVAKIAQKTGQALGATGDLYFKISQNTEKLGVSMTDVSRITETFAKTLAISGASTQGAEAAILQFGQALASGVIRGDEFNSVAENAPAAMDAFARALQVPKGALRALAADGKLTSDILIQALKEQSAEVDKSFEKTQTTISQGFVDLKNSAILFVGRINESTEVSKAFVSTIREITATSNALNIDEKAKDIKEAVHAAYTALQLYAGVKLTGLVVGFALSTKAAITNMMAQEALRVETLALATQDTASAGIALRRAEAEKALTMTELARARATSATALATHEAALADVQRANMEAALARGTQFAAAADIQKTVAAEKAALAMEQVVISANAEAVAVSRATVAAEANTIATVAQASAQTALANATATASAAARTASTILTGLGGPLGTVITLLGIGATAWFVFGDSAEKAVDKTKLAVDKINNNLSVSDDELQSLAKGLVDVESEIEQALTRIRAISLGSNKNLMANAERQLASLRLRRDEIKSAIETAQFNRTIDYLMSGGDETGLAAKMLAEREKQIAAEIAAKKAKEDEARAAAQLKRSYKDLLLSQKEQIELWGDDSTLAKLYFDLKNTELSKLLPKEKELLIIQQKKIEALKAEEKAKANQKKAEEEAKDFMAQQAQELDALRKSYATKNEIVYQAYLAREAIIQRAEARGSVLEAEAEQLRNANKKQLSDERVAIAKEEADKKKELDDQRLQATGQLFGNLATLMQTENRKLFEIGKAAAIAQAIVNTATAITNALAVPPYPLGLALASTAGIAGAVQIAAIQNQQFGGARAMGGDVQAGNQYLVGERGAEIITMGGNGHVTPNHKLGGGDTKVTIVNQTTGKIDRTEERRMPDGELILTVIEAVAAQTRDPNSKISRAQQQSYNLQRRR